MGGPISGDEKMAAARLLGCNVIESWGNTESLGTITESEDLETRPNSIGRPFLCDELAIVDDDLRPVRHGTQGRIAGGEEAGFLRYSNRPEATNKARREGLIISEDFGYQDEDGYFYILGRESDNVVRNGKSVFMSQIEARIRSHTLVLECCVTSVGDETAVEIVAIVNPTEPCDSETLRITLNVLLPEHEQIDRVLTMPVPRLPNGKFDRLACKRAAEREV
jgi:acyl-coenzyme A synthetase/AMP-(fatty) acid ligase